MACLLLALSEFTGIVLNPFKTIQRHYHQSSEVPLVLTSVSDLDP
jgi:hypothetical protein